MVPAPTQSDTLVVLGNFLAAILPSGVEIILGQPNRVPEPKAVDYVVMTPIRRPRLATNVNTPSDTVIVGSIAGATLTVTDVVMGELSAGRTVYGSGIVAGTRITALASGTGGTGTYTVTPAQSAISQRLAAGVMEIVQDTMWVVQLDVHGPGAGTTAADNAQVISTMMRDPYGFEFFTAAGDQAVPLFAEDPRQMPFTNAENQYEDRWVVDVSLQTNPAIVLPQQFADTVVLDTVSVEATFPP